MDQTSTCMQRQMHAKTMLPKQIIYKKKKRIKTYMSKHFKECEELQTRDPNFNN
jgi:hypothetical protein